MSLDAVPPSATVVRIRHNSAVGPEQAEYLVMLYVEGDAVHGDDIAVGLAKVLYLYC